MSCLSASTYLLPALKEAFPALGHLLATHPLSPSAWIAFYLADPINGFVATQILFMVGVYTAQQLTGNSSQVDRLWTIIPCAFTPASAHPATPVGASTCGRHAESGGRVAQHARAGPVSPAGPAVD